MEEQAEILNKSNLCLFLKIAYGFLDNVKKVLYNYRS